MPHTNKRIFNSGGQQKVQYSTEYGNIFHTQLSKERKLYNNNAIFQYKKARQDRA